MPELPEVQTVVDNLNALKIIGCCFTGAEVYWPKTIAGLAPDEFISTIKPLLLDQKFIAGLGNIYVDEALWEARIHPQRVSCSLSLKEVNSLHRAIPHVLNKGLRNMGTTLGSGEGNFYSVAGRRGRNADELNVFRRTGQACPRCGTVIERIIVVQRSSHICSKCQLINLHRWELL